jgi:hypothetical protein
LLLKIQDLEEKLLEKQPQLVRVTDEKFQLVLRLLRSLLLLEGLLYATTMGYVVTSGLSAPFSKLRDQMSR